jgi:transcriptional regulator with XRE-family HTH domain
MSPTTPPASPDQIIRIRLLLGDSQTAFGRRLGRSLRQVQRLESGETAGTIELALALIAILRGLNAPGDLAAAIADREACEHALKSVSA